MKDWNQEMPEAQPMESPMYRPTALVLTFLLLSISASRSPAQTPTVPEGSQFQANSYTTSFQVAPSLAVDAQGGFVVVWQSYGSDGDQSEYSVQARRFTSDGTAAGGDFQVNSFTTSYQSAPSVAMDAQGDFVVVWESYGSAGSDSDSWSVQVQLFASDGSASGGELQVNSFTTDAQFDPSVAMDTDGSFVVAWVSEGSAGSDNSLSSVQAQRFTSGGTPLGAEIQVNSTTLSSQRSPSMAMDTQGGFVVAWESVNSAGSDSSGTSVQAQRFASDGSTLGAEVQVNSFTTGDQRFPSVAMDTQDNFVVVWRSLGSAGTDSEGTSIQAQRFASDSTTLGAELQVNSYTTGSQVAPSVTVDAQGDFVVVWQSSASPGDDASANSVQAQRFASDGTAIGGGFQVNSFTTGDQLNPSVGVDAQGDFVVAWQSNGSADSDSDAFSIQVQRFRVTADIGDRVWSDEDLNGLQDGGEPGVEGISVHLYEQGGMLLESTTTDGDGAYLFQPKIALAGVPDQFYLDFEPPAGVTFTTPDVGPDDTVDSDADPVFGETPSFEILSAGETRLDLDAGLIIPPPIFADGFESGDTLAWSSSVP